jgi:hypothetical protein
MKRGSTLTLSHLQRASPCYIQALPTELLSKVFEFSVSRSMGRGGVHAHSEKVSFRSTPLSLLGVCERWKALALNLPCLWDAICPSFNSLPLMKYWLSLAPPHTQFHLKFIPHCPTTLLSDPNLDHTREMFGLFAGVYKRWRSLEIDLSPSLCAELVALLEATRDDPVWLRSLTVRFMDIPPPTDLLVRTLSRLPESSRLERLCWVCTLGERVPLHPIPCQGQLSTVLVAHVAPVNDYVAYLSGCTTASSVKLLNLVAFPEKQDQQQQQDDEAAGALPLTLFLGSSRPPRVLPLLTTLSLSRGTDPMVLLQHFVLPSLRCLTIGVRHRNHGAFRSFLRGSPHLETLIIDESWRQDADMATDQDLVEYLTDPHIRRIPHVQLACTDASVRALGIVQRHADLFFGENENANAQSLGLSCWMDCFKENPEELEVLGCAPIAFLGWPGLDSGNLVWRVRDGKVEFNRNFILLGAVQ